MAKDDLIDQLRQTRADYAEELVWHRFLLDAYTGTGGFAGKIKQPATGYLGWAAETYSNSSVTNRASGSVETYLDAYPREDADKFRRRQDVAHYPNYTESIVDLLLSYVLKREMTVENRPARLDAWADDVTGRGLSWDKQRNVTLIPRAALLGWVPQIIDADASPDGATRAQASDVRARSIPLFPANLLDWDADESGQFNWAKLRLDYTKRPDPLGPVIKEEHYLLWDRQQLRKYIIRKTDAGETIEALPPVPNKAGIVPLVIWRHKPSPDDPVRGLGMVDGIAPEVRRLFNLLSELDEHMRQQVFAMLQVPGDVAEVMAGTDNALSLPVESKHEYKWIAPPEGPAATYETRIAATIHEIYRLARTESDRAIGSSATSGIARAYEFEKTNRRLGDFAESIADAEARVYKVLAKVLGLGEGAADDVRVVAPTDFKVEDLATAIQNALDAVGLGLGGTAEARIKQRVVDKMLPNLSRSDRDVIDQEIEDARELAERAAGN